MEFLEISASLQHLSITKFAVQRKKSSFIDNAIQGSVGSDASKNGHTFIAIYGCIEFVWHKNGS